MLAGRDGLVTKGHELEKLYSTLPDFLKEELGHIYSSDKKAISHPITVLAIAQRCEKPELPEKTQLDSSFASFDFAIKNVSNIFTRARYFFEEVNHDYSYLEYPVGQIGALINALDKTYNKYILGSFKVNQA